MRKCNHVIHATMCYYSVEMVKFECIFMLSQTNSAHQMLKSDNICRWVQWFIQLCDMRPMKKDTGNNIVFRWGIFIDLFRI